MGGVGKRLPDFRKIVNTLRPLGRIPLLRVSWCELTEFSIVAEDFLAHQSAPLKKRRLDRSSTELKKELFLPLSVALRGTQSLCFAGCEAQKEWSSSWLLERQWLMTKPTTVPIYAARAVCEIKQADPQLCSARYR